MTLKGLFIAREMMFWLPRTEAALAQAEGCWSRIAACRPMTDQIALGGSSPVTELCTKERIAWTTHLYGALSIVPMASRTIVPRTRIAHKTRTVCSGGCSLLVVILLLVLLIPPVWGQDLRELGGVVIAQLPTWRLVPEISPDLFRVIFTNRFIGSPSIAIMEDGTYLASHDIFIKGSPDPYETRVFRSTDKGQSWTWVSTLTNLNAATLFTSGRFAYIMGEARKMPLTPSGCIEDAHEGDDNDKCEKQNVVRKSLDQGSSWGAVYVIGGDRDANGTPSPPVIYNDRIWFAASLKGAMTAALSDSVLDQDAWRYTGEVDTSPDWLNGTFGSTFWSEGQVVASPHTGVVVLPKIDNLPYTGLIRVSYDPESDESTAEFDPDTGFVPLPGAEKKFACVYDAVSQKFYALTNPVLAAHANDPDWPPKLIRNTGAVLSSTDLRTWRLEKIILYSPNIDYEAFQYFNFAIDGDDLAVVARTALRVGPGPYERPPRGHDSNILSFHRIKSFRQLRRELVFVADTNNRVLSYETNLTIRPAPLGTFDTIGEAVDAAPQGAIVSIMTGSYSGGMTVNKALTLTTRDGPVTIGN
jgi:hypothetical protein